MKTSDDRDLEWIKAGARKCERECTTDKKERNGYIEMTRERDWVTEKDRNFVSRLGKGEEGGGESGTHEI